MKGKQIALSERIRRVDRGIAADESAPVYAIQRSAELALKDFFLDPEYYSRFMELAEQMPQEFGFGEIHTYLDAVRLTAFCMRSDDEKLLELGSGLLYDLSTNYIDMYVVFHGLNNEQYRKDMHDVVRAKSISARPLAWRLGNMPSGKLAGFPAIYLPVNQLYHGVSVLAGNNQPDQFYRETVLPCIGSMLVKYTNQKNTAESMGYCGGITATHLDSDGDKDEDYDLYAAENSGVYDLDDTDESGDEAESGDTAENSNTAEDGNAAKSGDAAENADAAKSGDAAENADAAGSCDADENKIDVETDEACSDENTQSALFDIPPSVNEKNRLIWYIAVMPYVLSFGEKE